MNLTRVANGSGHVGERLRYGTGLQRSLTQMEGHAEGIEHGRVPRVMAHFVSIER
jgi:hypothetical protein